MGNAQINEVVKHKSLGLAFSSDVTWTEHIAYIVNEAWWSDQFGNFAFLFNCTPVGRTSDSMCFAVTCWERDDLLALVCGV